MATARKSREKYSPSRDYRELGDGSDHTNNEILKTQTKNKVSRRESSLSSNNSPDFKNPNHIKGL